MPVDLKFDGVSKKYSVQKEAEHDGRGGQLVRKIRSLFLRSEDFWALKDVCFEVQRGEALGIIGHNGAGKSTILKLLSSITTPTSGEIVINGRLAALIEVGSGFHPELTGRENIYLNGSILGMKRREITEQIDNIIDFAGIKAFVDMPVKRYSSGMYVRLGFSIAAHLNPEILLLDEVLAVGDASFQAKCLQRITDLKQAGKTIVFVSHDLGAVERLCDRVILMHRGQVMHTGAPREVIVEYERVAQTTTPAAEGRRGARGKVNESKVTAISLSQENGEKSLSLRTGEPFKIELECTTSLPVEDVVVTLTLVSQEGQPQCLLTTETGEGRVDLDSGVTNISFMCDALGLLPGIYYVDALIRHRDDLGAETIDWKNRCIVFRVDPGEYALGAFYMPHRWRIESQPNNSPLVAQLAEMENKAASY